MRTFEDSQKSKKTVASMIENKKDEKKGNKGKENKLPKGMHATVILCIDCPLSLLPPFFLSL